MCSGRHCQSQRQLKTSVSEPAISGDTREVLRRFAVFFIPKMKKKKQKASTKILCHNILFHYVTTQFLATLIKSRIKLNYIKLN